MNAENFPFEHRQHFLWKTLIYSISEETRGERSKKSVFLPSSCRIHASRLNCIFTILHCCSWNTWSFISVNWGREKKMLLITQLYRQRACIAVAPKTHTYTHTHHNYYSRTVEDGRFSYGRDDDAFVKKMAERVRPFFSSLLPSSFLSFLQKTFLV